MTHATKPLSAYTVTDENGDKLLNTIDFWAAVAFMREELKDSVEPLMGVASSHKEAARELLAFWSDCDITCSPDAEDALYRAAQNHWAQIVRKHNEYSR